MLGLRPSLDKPIPLITARTRSPSLSASGNRLSTTTPAPSPNTTPSALTSKGRLSCRANPLNCANSVLLARPGSKDSTGQDHVTFAVLQTLDAQIGRIQRGRAGSINYINWNSTSNDSFEYARIKPVLSKLFQVGVLFTRDLFEDAGESTAKIFRLIDGCEQCL